VQIQIRMYLLDTLRTHRCRETRFAIWVHGLGMIGPGTPRPPPPSSRRWPHHFCSALLSRHSLHFQGRSACPAHVSVSRTGLFCRISPFAVRDGIYIYISCGLTSPARYYNLLPSNLSRSLYGCAHCSSNLFRHLLLLK